jgi:hypothetical protein
VFEIERALARITSFNPRAESHGKEQVPAADIHFEITTSNRILSHFGSQLRASLFTRNEPQEAAPKAQGELDVVPPISDMPYLRNPSLAGPLHVTFEGVGYTLTVDYGIAGSEIVLDECTVKDVRIDPKEGGSVELTLRVSKSDIQLKERGVLSGLVKRETTISLVPPGAGQGRIAS